MEELRELLLTVTIKCNNIEENGCGIYNFVSDYAIKEKRDKLIEDLRGNMKELDKALEKLSRWEP